MSKESVHFYGYHGVFHIFGVVGSAIGFLAVPKFDIKLHEILLFDRELPRLGLVLSRGFVLDPRHFSLMPLGTVFVGVFNARLDQIESFFVFGLWPTQAPF